MASLTSLIALLTLTIALCAVSARATQYVHHHHNYYGAVNNYHDDDDDDDHDDDDDDNGGHYAMHHRGHHDDDDDHHVEHHRGDRDDDDHHVEHHRGDHDDDHHVEHHDDDDDPHVEHHDDEKDRVYRFRIGENYGAYGYTNAQGEIHGFVPDLVLKVCQHANKRCYWTFDTFSNCWQTSGQQELPGRGLMDGWYDGCAGAFPTKSRQNSFNFTLPFTESLQVALYQMDGAVNENPSQLRDKIIGFVDGWALGRVCLAKQSSFSGNQPGDYVERLYPSMTELAEALKAGEVDLMVGEYNRYYPHRYGVVVAGAAFQCNPEGLAVMTPYGSDVIDWWNAAFEEMYESGEFRRFCASQIVTHGHAGEINCRR